MQSLSQTSTAGVLLDLSGVLILLLAFACLASKLFNRYVVYYGAQSVVLSFAAGTAAVVETVQIRYPPSLVDISCDSISRP